MCRNLLTIAFFKINATRLLLLSAALLFACGGGSAGIRIDINGSKAPIKISINQGVCKEITYQSSNQLTSFECGARPGNRRIAVKCELGDLPEAYMEHFFPIGDSHYVVFNNVCGSTASEIREENMRSRGQLAVWGQALPKQ
jgi:hypothetical protein